jgi:hypothetical protein
VKIVLLPACLLALCVPVAAQNQPIRDLGQVLPNGSLPLTLLHLNDVTTPLLFQPPTLYSMRARAKQSTLFYVQGTARQPVKLDTTNFTIEQAGESVASTPINIKHFEKGTVSVAKGDEVDGILVFDKLVDVTHPFTIEHGRDKVKVEFTKDQLEEMTPAPAK